MEIGATRNRRASRPTCRADPAGRLIGQLAGLVQRCAPGRGCSRDARVPSVFRYAWGANVVGTSKFLVLEAASAHRCKVSGVAPDQRPLLRHCTGGLRWSPRSWRTSYRPAATSTPSPLPIAAIISPTRPETAASFCRAVADDQCPTTLRQAFDHPLKRRAEQRVSCSTRWGRPRASPRSRLPCRPPWRLLATGPRHSTAGRSLS